jgi:glycosyltransferase involved in cell wall biosynthesis
MMVRSESPPTVLEAEVPVGARATPPRRRVGLVASTPFWMFDHGKELTQRGWDVALCTATPAWMIDPRVARDVHVKLGWATLAQVLRRLGRLGIDLPESWFMWMGRRARTEFVTWAARQLDGVEIVDALSSWGLEAGRAVKRGGGRYVCSRGSSHILFQKTILEEEFARWSRVKLSGFPDWLVDRELAEYESADAIAVPSGFVLRTFLAHGVPAHKLHLCPYGANLALYSPRPRHDDRFRVLFVGTVSIRKGIGYLLEAMRPLVRRNLAELWLVGAPSPDARDLLARNGDLFIHKGFVPPPRLAEIYSQGSVLVLPSIEEGLGRVQVQGMACGIPVIATSNTGVEDVLTDGQEGFIVPIRDTCAIRERLEWMIDHPVERQRMGEAAVQRVTSIGGWHAYGLAVERMYQRLLAS